MSKNATVEVVNEVVRIHQKWASFEAAGAYCGLDPRTLRRLASDGAIIVSKPRGKMLVLLSSLDELLERCVVTSA